VLPAIQKVIGEVVSLSTRVYESHLAQKLGKVVPGKEDRYDNDEHDTVQVTCLKNS
jgi:hypothetical protein